MLSAPEFFRLSMLAIIELYNEFSLEFVGNPLPMHFCTPLLLSLSFGSRKLLYPESTMISHEYFVENLWG